MFIFVIDFWIGKFFFRSISFLENVCMCVVVCWKFPKRKSEKWGGVVSDALNERVILGFE